MYQASLYTPALSLDLQPYYRVYTLHNYRQISQIQKLSAEQRFELEVVGHVFPFKTNNYVVEELIDWDAVPQDPLYVLNFPQKNMLRPHHFAEMAAVLKKGANRLEIEATANRIRQQLNPHPAGQITLNIPFHNGRKLLGIQHKYRETVLFFPSQGQTCHAYCSFCFRWPQFVGVKEWKLAMKETELLIDYLRQHTEVTDVLFTGGDPLIMKARTLASYINPILQARLPHIHTIRIGTKALAFWPYKFLTGDDAAELLSLFKKVVKSGKHLAFMAHFNHPREMSTEVVREAIARIRETGAEIRTQAPLLNHINNDANVWAEMWGEQVRLGCIPYYMFVVRDTGAQHYFGVPLVEAWRIYTEAHKKVSGLARTVRGPVMSAEPGKIQVLGLCEMAGKKVIVLRMLRGRDPDWEQRPFFALYDEKAIWIDELTPAFGEQKFFFESELEQMFQAHELGVAPAIANTTSNF